MNSDLTKEIKSFSGLRPIFYILFSFFLFFIIVFVFGDGYKASESLLIVLFSSSISVATLIYLFRNILFSKIDAIFISLIFLIQAAIGILHFISIINSDYFSESILGVDLSNDHYYFDVFYFTYLMDQISLSRLDDGYFSIDIASGVLHKNYFLAYLVSDLFYFGDSYVLNFMAINILSLFYSGILLSVITLNLFKITNSIKLKTVFYLTILQPLAWIPSHSMRDIFGTFIVVLAVSMIFQAQTKLQKLISYSISIALVFQHRSIYALSILGTIFLRNMLFRKNIRDNALLILSILIISFFIFTGSGISSAVINIFLTSQENSMIGGAVNDRGANIIFHFIKLLVGPFPWTQYYDGSISGYATWYSSIQILHASWSLTVIFILFKNIKNIFSFSESKNLFLIILLFGVPAIFSLGGHNLYLLPSIMLSIPLLVAMTPLRNITSTFFLFTLFYISTSGLFYFTKYHFL